MRARGQIDIIRSLSAEASFDFLWAGWGNFSELAGVDFKEAFSDAWSAE